MGVLMSNKRAAHNLNERRQTVLKAVVIGAHAERRASLQVGDEGEAAFAGALEPPYDAEALCMLFEHANSLRQSIDAYATNIDGFGHRFEPAIDLDAPDARQRVADSLYLERIAARDRGELEARTTLQSGEEEAGSRLDELQRLSRIERARLEAFFDFCCFDHSFVDLRRCTRQDLEVTGNAFWKVLRNARCEVARLVYAPSHSVRLLPLDKAPTEVTERMRVSAVSYEAVTTRRWLRRYVQLSGTSAVYFKPTFGRSRRGLG
jgi:capsid portal protein